MNSKNKLHKLKEFQKTQNLIQNSCRTFCPTKRNNYTNSNTRTQFRHQITNISAKQMSRRYSRANYNSSLIFSPAKPNLSAPPGSPPRTGTHTRASLSCSHRLAGLLRRDVESAPNTKCTRQHSRNLVSPRAIPKPTSFCGDISRSGVIPDPPVVPICRLNPIGSQLN